MSSLIRPRKSAPPATDTGGGLYFSSPKENIHFIRSGCTLLDCVLGGGWPLGRMVNIVGDKSTGKTLLAMEAFANLFLSYPKAKAWYNEAEAAFDEDYAGALGIPINQVERVPECRTVEEFYGHIEMCVGESKGEPSLYVLDSLDALSDAAELERDFEKGNYGTKAKQMSAFFRQMTQPLAKANICLMIISQVRENIGAMFGEKYTRAGGKALDFYASQIQWLAHTGIIKRTVNKVERPVGVNIKSRNSKNKVGLPFRSCEFEITFGYGVEDEKASKEFLKTVGGSIQGGEDLRTAVIRKWFEIEKSFLPERRKYGS